MDASNRTECLSGTRADVIEFIEDWASNLTTAEGVVWLHGLAGSGNATIIANRFHEVGCLGAFLFFDRDVAERSRPAIMIWTTAYQLARNHRAAVGTKISAVIDQFPSINEAPLHFQFSKLLIEPLSLFISDSTLVIIFDALDKCGNPDYRQKLLTVLGEESYRLPSSIRLIVASRAEYSIRTAFVFKAHIHTRELDIASKANAADIRSYFRNQLAVIRKTRSQLSFPEDWPGDSAIGHLSECAFGLFVWASTAKEFIRRADYPANRFKTLLQDGPTSGAKTALDALYQTALEDAGKWDDDEFVEDYRAIMGTVLVARNPLSISAIDLLLGIPSANTIALFGCVLIQHPTVRVLHPSFADFITQIDAKRTHG